MQVQFNTPRGIVTTTRITHEFEAKWKETIIDVLKGKSDWIRFSDINGDTVFLSAEIIKESVISFIKTGYTK